MNIEVKKIGDSKTLIIPSDICEYCHVGYGTRFELIISGNSVVLKQVNPKEFTKPLEVLNYKPLGFDIEPYKPNIKPGEMTLNRV
jgi:antitoxin component of MazEF toxin-antitoxin module